MSRPTAFLSVFLAAIAMLSPATGGANTVDKLTHLTFSGPVHVPGVILDAGTYRFRLTNPDTSRNVVQVLSQDGSAVYAMFHTMPDSRAEVTTHAMVTFKETPAGVPPVVRSLFYGGEYRGYEFVYPSGDPVMLRTDRPQPAITYAASAPVPVADPVPEPVTMPSARVPYAPVAAPVQTELPRTATRLPWVTVGGFVTLMLGLGVGLLRRHLS